MPRAFTDASPAHKLFTSTEMTQAQRHFYNTIQCMSYGMAVFAVGAVVCLSLSAPHSSADFGHFHRVCLMEGIRRPVEFNHRLQPDLMEG